jgi:RNA polymerase sigma factor (TIGR02999 family)
MNAPLLAAPAAADGPAPPAPEALFATLYAELRRLAGRQVARGMGVTLGPTTLLHEAYLAIGHRAELDFADRGHFLAYAARVMRGLIIDHLRGRSAQRRGGRVALAPLDTDVPDPGAQRDELARLSAALDELARVEGDLAEIVDLKFFCGFSFAEIASLRGVCERTVQRKWEKARLYLYREVAADAAA